MYVILNYDMYSLDIVFEFSRTFCFFLLPLSLFFFSVASCGLVILYPCRILPYCGSSLSLQLEGLWVSYRMTSLCEADLYITIPKFSILDIRPDTKPEMRLMLGSCIDAHSQNSPETDVGFPTSTMFVMDCRWRLSSQSFVLRIQQPRILVVPDFLLSVCEYFVPSLGALTGREEIMDPKNDPISKNNSIILSAPLYEQKEDLVILSPNRQLVADAVGIDEYTYDGCGKTLRLTDKVEVKGIHSSGIQHIIIIGRGKRLRFVNVKIEVLTTLP